MLNLRKALRQVGPAVLATSLFTLGGWTVVSAQQHTAHVHGVGELEVVSQGQDLTVNLMSPLDNWVGFERPPRTEREKAALDALRTAVEKGSLLQPNPQAQCVLKSGQFDSGLKPSRDAAATGHAESQAQWVFACQQPTQLKTLELTVFKAYPGFKTVKAAVVNGQKQAAATLSAKKPLLTFP